MKPISFSFFMIFWLFPVFANCQIIDSSVIKSIDSLLLSCNGHTVKYEFDAAVENLLAAEQLAISKFGKQSIYYGNCCHFRGQMLNFQGEYESAKKCYMEAVEIKKSLLGSDNLIYANSLFGLSGICHNLGEYDTAHSYMNSVKEIRGKLLENTHPDYIKCIIGLAVENKFMYKYKESETFYLEALNLVESSTGKTGNNYIYLLNSIADLYSRIGEFKKSETSYEELIQIMKNNPTSNRGDYALILGNYAVLCREIGQYEKSESFFLESIAIQGDVLGKEHSSYGRSLMNLANLYLHSGQLKKSESINLEALAILEKSLGEEHPNYISCLSNLGTLYSNMGQYEKAELIYLEVMNLREKILGKEHPAYAQSLNNLAILYNEIGNYEKAIPILIEALSILEKVQGKKDNLYAVGIFNLASLYLNSGQYEKAKPLFLEGLPINEELFGKESPEYAQILSSLATLYRDMGQSERAEPMYLEAIAIQEKVMGIEHLVYASSIINLAILYRNMGQYEKAELHYLDAKAIREKVGGKQHPDYIESVNNLAGFYETQYRYDEALELMTEAQELGQSRLAGNASFLSEQELSSNVAHYMGRASIYAYLFARPDKLVGGLPALAYNQSLFQKGFLMQAAVRLRSLSFDSPEAIAVNNKLNSCRYLIAQQLSLPIAEQQRLEELEAEANTLEKELSRTVAGYAEAMKQVKWQDVQSTLNPDEAAIEFIQINIAVPSDSVMYAALVLTPSSPQPVFVPLFEEKQLKTALAQTGDQQDGEVLAQIYTRGLVPQNAGNNQDHLYDLCWKPLDRLLGGIKTIYYSPAGMLHQINFDAIPSGDGSQDKVITLSDRFALVRLLSTRSLVVPDQSKINSTNDMVLVGGIQYELDTTLTVTDTLLEEPVMASSELSFEYAYRSAPKRGDNWNDLPGTKREVLDISKIMERAHFPVEVYQGYLATEESVKQLGRGKSSPRVLHFATHGFFFPNPKNALKTSKLSEEKAVFRMSDHPMIRSGLLLAGSNYAWKMGKSWKKDMEDGILTAYEISQMNLSNTELVVLSACETGLGDIEGNEGVYGLQRAFKIAGAKYLIMSLWQVPDRETMEFMTTFYKNWLPSDAEALAGKEGKLSIPDAFRKTQREMRDRFINPYSWAGFVLVE